MISRTPLLAADLALRAQKNPQRALDLLTNFESSIAGVEGNESLLAEALFIRVQALMALGKNTEATATASTLLQSKGGNEGARIVFGLLEKLDADMDQARKQNNAERQRQLADSRAAISGFLVEWSKNNPDPNIQKYAYRYAVFDAATKHMAANLENDPAQKQEKLKQALDLYKSLESPANRKLYAETIEKGSGVDPNAPDPSVSYVIGLIEFDLKNYKEAQARLGPLIYERKLGNPTREVVDADGSIKTVENEMYWEGVYKLLRSNAEVAAEDPKAMEATKTYLKNLYIRYGSEVGGANWNDEMDALRRIRPVGPRNERGHAAGRSVIARPMRD
jgi:hypothetical protein